ncbi:shikimate dehydrogenase [Escherichia coli]|uniref:NnaD n=1 Tax=Escherichia coli TaxID=562 RepID=Q077R6_ECOLX|nr:NeuD/PglB/VioB family sugar acetyltransferase [Escherichia coli]ABB29909.1 NnaD [Escherichia coli]EFH3485515.1 shikimate dehydrogenase [Escherichia coli]EFJ5530695.1 shikimate dehydrogenase [Escherichia coli]EFL6578914.1 shikimate dehydrogenase [Escherichia coli]EFN7668717.1 shikimate dehydrogenase [Escherichia coli]
MKKRLIIIGAGGFAKAVIDSLDHEQYEVYGFIDSFKSGEHQGYKILSKTIDGLNEPNQYCYFIAIGEPCCRAIWLETINNMRLETINVIDKTAIVSKRAILGTCIYVGKMAIVNCDSHLEDGVVINTRALVEHGNYISYCSNISTNVVLNGDVFVGRKCFIGSCTVVNGQLKIGDSSIVGSGSVVIRNIDKNIVVAGTPTRLIRKR